MSNESDPEVAAWMRRLEGGQMSRPTRERVSEAIQRGVTDWADAVKAGGKWDMEHSQRDYMVDAVMALFTESDGEFNADLRSLATTPEAKAFAEKLISAGKQSESDGAGEGDEARAKSFRESFEFGYLGGPMFGLDGDALERAAVEFEKRLAAEFAAIRAESSAALTAARSENHRLRVDQNASLVICDCHPDVRWPVSAWGRGCPLTAAIAERDEFAEALFKTYTHERLDEHDSAHGEIVAKARRIVEGT